MASSSAPHVAGHRQGLYVGSYGHGIALAVADPATGLATRVGTAADTPDPSYLAISHDRRVLYAVNELDAGTVSAFAVAPDGVLRPLGSRPTYGASPCHVHVHPSGRYVLSANYGSGSVTVHPVDADGALEEPSDVVRHTGSGPDPARQQGPHAHQIVTDPAGGFVHAVDLGADAVFTYRLRAGKLAPAGEMRTRPGSGPRHLSFHPSGRQAYLTEELTSTVTACTYAPEQGRLTAVQTLATAPRTDTRNYPSELLVSADGRFVYVANRGHNSVAVFAVDGDRLTARGTVPSGGDWPRHIAFSRDGHFLYAANQKSGQLATLRVDRRDGSLTPAGPALSSGTPTMVLPV
ncbi:MAG: lactonase family protein [Micromonosporaceae bacterium]